MVTDKMSSKSEKTENPEPKKNILIGCTGSVATIKLSLLVAKLLENKRLEVQVVATEHAKHFFKREELPSNVAVFFDENEWSAWQKRSDPVIHIELAKWADLFVIAPLDANTLTKLAVVSIIS